MRDRDAVGYKRGKQAKHKMQVVTIVGWASCRTFKQAGNADMYAELADVVKKPTDKLLVLFYSMYGKSEATLRVPFRYSDKFGTQMRSHDISHLKQGDHCVAWCDNYAKTVSAHDTSGDWYWSQTMVVNKRQAEDIIAFKRGCADIDMQHPLLTIKLVRDLGYPHGNQFYDFAVRRHGGEPDHLFMWLQAHQMYCKDQDKLTSKQRAFADFLQEAANKEQRASMLQF